MSGFRVSFEFSEFVTSALLITVAACTVGYFYTHRAPTEIVKESTVKVETQYIPTPEAKVRVNIHVVYPKPEPKPNVEPLPQPQSQLRPKLWDNDTLADYFQRNPSHLF
jgi:hypothetical protein